MLKLHELLKVFKEGQISEALFEDIRWYIKYSNGHIWYYDIKSETPFMRVTLKFEDLNADYKIIDEEDL